MRALIKCDMIHSLYSTLRYFFSGQSYISWASNNILEICITNTLVSFGLKQIKY